MRFYLTLLAFATSFHAASAVVFTNNVSVDAFVRASAPTLNYGGGGAVSISGASATNGAGVANGVSDSFLRVNTAAMVASFDAMFGSNNWIVSEVKLRVTEQGAPPSGVFNRGKGGFEVRWIANDNWIEGTGNPAAPSATGIKYNDVATLLNGTTDVTLGTFTNTGLDGPLTFPLQLPTAFVNDLLAGNEVGFYLTATESLTGFTMNSRSVSLVSSRPFLEISAVARPVVTGINLAGTDVVITGTNGVAGGNYYVRSSTNLSLPLNQWLSVTTNVLSTNGTFVITVPDGAASGVSPQFFILQTD